MKEETFIYEYVHAQMPGEGLSFFIVRGGGGGLSLSRQQRERERERERERMPLGDLFLGKLCAFVLASLSDGCCATFADVLMLYLQLLWLLLYVLR